MKVRNIFIIFIVSGFWHGANWTFIFWGALNAVYFLPLLLLKRNRKNLDVIASESIFPSFREFAGMVITFLLTLLAWIFFRAESMGHAFGILSEIFSESLFTLPDFSTLNRPTITLLLIIVFILIEWMGRKDQYAIALIAANWKRPYRWILYFVLVFAIYLLGNFSKSIEFIYFQF